MKRDIVERKFEDGPTRLPTRILSCGHKVKEPHGGRAKLAKTVDCKQCGPDVKVGLGRDLRDNIKVKHNADGSTEMSVKPGSGIDLRDHMLKPEPKAVKPVTRKLVTLTSPSVLDALNARLRNL